MTVEYMRRFATGLDQYEFAEVRSENFQEFVEAAANLADYVLGSHVDVARSGGADPAQDKAIQTLEKNGLRTSLPGLNKKPTFGGGSKPAGDDDWKGRTLGEVEGNEITAHATGKHGPFFKAYNKADKTKQFKNMPKGLDPAEATLDDALAAFNG